MDPERWRRVEELYHAAQGVPQGERAGWLQTACKEDSELRSEVASLLLYDSSAQEFIERPAFEVAAKLVAGDNSDASPKSPLLAGTKLGRFRILDKLGGGGMGVVYKAEDTRLQRSVALKFLPPDLTGDPLALERFQREAHAASALNHPNICTIYDTDEIAGQPFISMELLEGQTLEQRIGGKPLPVEELMRFGIQILNALEAAHARGILHRDIKPSNIFVTPRDEAKILDFGLAKLQGSDHPDASTAVPGNPESTQATNLSLSLTGVAMGTAGYMSPEQVRGEKLDARTDLFSLGSVLYEMATGTRAFKGETGPVLNEAILKQAPAPARELNPKLPAKLQRIIGKALEKDREARYQSASEMRAQLAALTQTSDSYRWWAAAAALLFLVFVAAAYFWMKGLRTTLRQTALELKYRQITTNPPENRVISGTISPDGKYLVYSDQKGMHIRQMDTGEIRPIPQPLEIAGNLPVWEVTTLWLPGGTRFIAHTHEPGEDTGGWDVDKSSIWVGSVLGGPPNKLRDHAMAYAISPDGSQISFGTNGEHEIWVMGPDGEHPHKFFESEPGHNDCCLGWSPDGQRLLYLDGDAARDVRMLSRDVNGGPPTTLFPPSEMKNLYEIVWTKDGRLIYGVPEPGADGTCNYWIRRIDFRTGARLDEPRRLTNWTGFCPSSGSLTADEKRLTFLGWVSHMTVYAADLDAGGTRLRNSRRFTLDESNNNPIEWTPDSKSIILFSNRTGRDGIYKQALDADSPELLTSTSDGFNGARVSPDGKWIISHLTPNAKGPSNPVQLVRVPIAGGSPELIFTMRDVGLISCAKPPSNLCVIGERSEDRKQVIVTSLDPLKGRGSELLRFNADPKLDGGWFCDLSPDGSRLAVVASPNEPIQILSLRGQPPQLIPSKETKNFQFAYWSADGKGLFVTHGVKEGSELVHMDLQGNTKALWKNNGGYYPWGLQSPDGRHIAIQGSVQSGNMWIMENF